MENSTKPVFIPTTVRVYFDADKVMNHGQHGTDSKGPNVYHSIASLPIRFDQGQFFIDAANGKVPCVFSELLDGTCSIFNSDVRGFREPGIYRDEKFSRSEARVTQHLNPSGASIHCIVEVYGDCIDDVIGLYQAIVANELSPLPVDKTAPELVKELQHQLKDSETTLNCFQTEIRRLKDLLTSRQGCVEDLESERARLYQRIVELETTENSLTTQIEIFKSQRDQLQTQYDNLWTRRPWYQKLSERLGSGRPSMSKGF